MKIGLVSDSHGDGARLARALAMLIEHGAEAIVHCGDIGSDECIRLLGAVGVPAWAVAGNMDRHLPHLARTAAGVGVQFHEQTVELPLSDGRFLIATHGNDERLMGELAAGRQFAYFCHGHTHRRRDQRLGNMRIINPGALHRAHPHSAALLNTETDELNFYEVP